MPPSNTTDILAGVAAPPSPVSPLSQSPEELCLQLGWKVTAARRAIFHALELLDGYFDAEVLLAEAKTIHDGVSRATIYRALPDLCEAGLLRATEFGDGHHRYCRHDPSAPPTAEVFVVDCGRILKVSAPFLTWYANAITERAGYELLGQRLQTFARCKDKKNDPQACQSCEHKPVGTSPVSS